MSELSTLCPSTGEECAVRNAIADRMVANELALAGPDRRPRSIIWLGYPRPEERNIRLAKRLIRSEVHCQQSSCDLTELLADLALSRDY